MRVCVCACVCVYVEWEWGPACVAGGTGLCHITEEVKCVCSEKMRLTALPSAHFLTVISKCLSDATVRLRKRKKLERKRRERQKTYK